MSRLISWHNDAELGRIAGIEAKKNGWAVVDNSKEVLLFIEGFTPEARGEIERFYEKYICQTKNMKNDSKT